MSLSVIQRFSLISTGLQTMGFLKKILPDLEIVVNHKQNLKKTQITAGQKTDILLHFAI